MRTANTISEQLYKFLSEIQSRFSTSRTVRTFYEPDIGIVPYSYLYWIANIATPNLTVGNKDTYEWGIETSILHQQSAVLAIERYLSEQARTIPITIYLDAGSGLDYNIPEDWIPLSMKLKSQACDLNTNRLTVKIDCMNPNERMELLSVRSSETIGLEEIERKMIEGKTITAYWGTEPTGSPSLGYLIPLLKIRDLVRADVRVTIFIADVHAFLNKGVDAIDKTQERSDYYIFLLRTILSSIGVDPDQYEIVKGSDIQLSKSYIMEFYKFSSRISVAQAKKAGSNVVKESKEPKLSSLVYPLMQVIDEEFLGADIQLGGTDQRKIFTFSRDHVSRERCAYILNPLLPSFNKPGTKMSASDSLGKIDFFDSKEDIDRKIRKAYCVEKDSNLETEPLLCLLKYIIFPLSGCFGRYTDLESFISDWSSGNVDVFYLKETIADTLESILSPIRTAINADIELYERAYGGISIP
jgi:tyrosyl-tRNA synthetase